MVGPAHETLSSGRGSCIGTRREHTPDYFS